MLVFVASLLGASIAIFVIINALPGDVATAILGMGADPASIVELRARLGLDQPGWFRYLTWIGGMATGNMGHSYLTGESVSVLVAPRIGVTAWLVVFSMVLAPLQALPLGMVAAMKRRNWQGLRRRRRRDRPVDPRLLRRHPARRAVSRSR